MGELSELLAQPLTCVMSYCESERLSRGFRKFTHWPKPEELSIALANVYAARKVKSAALRSTVICPAWYTELARLAVKLLSWLKSGPKWSRVPGMQVLPAGVPEGHGVIYALAGAATPGGRV